jgi:hypothetical protein
MRWLVRLFPLFFLKPARVPVRRRVPPRHAAVLAVACGLAGLAGAAGGAGTAAAAGPRNPYSSFNLSGVNYGSQQWERAQREGRAVWPYYNVPNRSGSTGTRSAGGYVGGGTAGFVRPTPRMFGRWRR